MKTEDAIFVEEIIERLKICMIHREFALAGKKQIIQ